MGVQKQTDNTSCEAAADRLNHSPWEWSQQSSENSATEPELPTGSGHRFHKILDVGSSAISRKYGLKS